MLTHQEIKRTLEAIQGKRVAVIGDYMLDRYIWGNVRRISPEAPVPVVEVSQDDLRPGGAGNVVLNLISLGAKCSTVGLCGDDLNGRDLIELMKTAGAEVDGLITAEDRPTTIKTRVIAEDQHLLRVDRERTDNVTGSLETKLGDAAVAEVERADAVILQDYNKGALTPQIIRRVIQAAQQRRIPITVDPKHDNFFDFLGATVFKPNMREAESALGRRLFNDPDIERAGSELLLRLQAETVLITRGAQGMSLFTPNESSRHIPTRARKISDVSGAGDTVISTLTLGLVGGLDGERAAHLATLAAGYVVGQVGVVPVTKEALLTESGD
ncbi:D-glycero-beta-D-manno-heptose-7-phosphate kinase [bacterium]|nr:D-glycero-beta-D-manno-heptose-7-phosphate kinase [bacterium]